MNSFGNIFRLTTFGESHGKAIGGIIDGMPAGLAVDVDEIRRQLDRRRPAQNAIDSQRRESDRVEILSGVFEGYTLGTPIGFIIPNVDYRSADYEAVKHIYRPSHADFTYDMKYGRRDHRGGGRASARETACRVVGGAFARQALSTMNISVHSRALSVGSINVSSEADLAEAYSAIEAARKVGDTLGGVVECVVKGVPAGVGEPVFGKLQSLLAAAMMSIPTAKGFEYGMGFEGSAKRGSEVIDNFVCDGNGGITTSSNFSGGIQGGISNGNDIVMRVAFKPIATLMKPVETIDDEGRATIFEMKGRHDSCVVFRAMPVVEAMAAMTVFDAALMNRLSRL